MLWNLSKLKPSRSQSLTCCLINYLMELQMLMNKCGKILKKFKDSNLLNKINNLFILNINQVFMNKMVNITW